MKRVALVSVLLIELVAVRGTGATSIVCQPNGRLTLIPGVWEASGVAVANGAPPRFWVINDSAEPIVYSVDLSGQITGRVEVAGAQVDDWEDLASGPCPVGRCLYIADIGDNTARRSRITVYRMAEPRPGSVTAAVSAEAFHATYPDGPHDAESLFVDADGRIFIVTKGRLTTVYRFPSPPTANSTSRLEKVASLTLERETVSGAKGKDRNVEPATGAAISPDQNWVAIRSNHSAWFFRTRDLEAGRPADPIQADLSPLGEPQGEGIAFGSDETIYLVGEGGSKGRPGTLTSIHCSLPR
jgi:hypothetical protein